MKTLFILSLFVAAALVSGCGGGSSGGGSVNRVNRIHQELKIVDPSVSGFGLGDVSAQLVSLGSIYLESQLAPPTSSAGALQATESAVSSTSAYVAYSAYDTNGVIKEGAIDHVTVSNCDTLATLLHVDFCLNLQRSLSVPGIDLFNIKAESDKLWVVGATKDEIALPDFARLLNVSLDATTKRPSAITSQTILPSYAGTDVLNISGTLYASSGTSTDPTRIGGITALNAGTLATTASYNLHDVRALAADPSNAGRLWALKAYTDASNTSSLLEFDRTNLAAGPLRTIAVGGNTTAESKSGLIVGNQLVGVSLGAQGFKILCKATGATVASAGAVTVSGIPTARTVTNSIAGTPGYIFTANGEAGVYIYKFTKAALNFSTNYCNGVTLTLVGRLGLDTSAAAGINSTYTPFELSANSIRSVSLGNLLGLVSARFLFVASGNKGISLLNLSELNLLSGGVDDF